MSERKKINDELAEEFMDFVARNKREKDGRLCNFYCRYEGQAWREIMKDIKTGLKDKQTLYEAIQD